MRKVKVWAVSLLTIVSTVLCSTMPVYAMEKNCHEGNGVATDRNHKPFACGFDTNMHDPYRSDIEYFDYSDYDYWLGEDDDKESEGSCLGIVIKDAQIEGIVDIISGAYVEEIKPNTPVSVCGLTDGDLITGIDNHDITCAEDLVNYLRTISPYSKVTLEITWVNSKGYYKTTKYKTRTLDTRIFPNFGTYNTDVNSYE